MSFYHQGFFYKKSEGDIVIAFVSPSAVMISPPKPLDEIQPNLRCELHEWGVQHCYSTIVFDPANWGPGEGSKGQISLNFNYKVNF